MQLGIKRGDGGESSARLLNVVRSRARFLGMAVGGARVCCFFLIPDNRRGAFASRVLFGAVYVISP